MLGIKTIYSKKDQKQKFNCYVKVKLKAVENIDIANEREIKIKECQDMFKDLYQGELQVTDFIFIGMTKDEDFVKLDSGGLAFERTQYLLSNMIFHNMMVKWGF